MGMLQAAALPPTAGPIARIDFDLAKVTPSEPDPWACEDADGEEIVVCGIQRRAPVDRFTAEEMEALARRYAEAPPRAAMDLGGGAAGSFDFAPTPVPGGLISNRMMVTVKMPF